MTLTQERLKELLVYDPETGLFTWKVSPAASVKIGDTAGSLNSPRYCQIRIEGYAYLAHRLVWLYVHGNFPSAQIDHINGGKNDNRLANLRLATGRQNQANIGVGPRNSSGFKGVCWKKQAQKWYAYGSLNGKPKHLGRFDTAEAASAAYEAFAKSYHGEFYREPAPCATLQHHEKT